MGRQDGLEPATVTRAARLNRDTQMRFGHCTRYGGGREGRALYGGGRPPACKTTPVVGQHRLRRTQENT